jgi:hypothetical protein
LEPLFATLALILIALLGARISFSGRGVPSAYSLVLETGIYFVFVGFLLGPGALRLIDEASLDQLSPLLGLALGWIGLFFGLDLERHKLRHFDRSFIVVALGQAVLVFFIFLGIGFLAAGAAGFEGPHVTLLLLGAAATACISTPAGVMMVATRLRARGDVTKLLGFSASLDSVVGITALNVAYASMHGTPAMVASGGQPFWFWLLASVGLGVVCAVVFLWLARLRPSREELVLYLLGFSALCAGAGLQLQLSPLFVGMVTGILVTNLNPQWHRLFRLMARWEQPVYVILLLLAGAALRFSTWWVLLLAVAYAVVRGFAKVVSAAALTRLLSLGSVVPESVRLTFPVPKRLGLALVPQSGISVAMAVSLSLTVGAAAPLVGGVPAGELVFVVVVLGVVISEVVGPFFTAAVLRAAGEVPAPEAEPGA